MTIMSKFLLFPAFLTLENPIRFPIRIYELDVQAESRIDEGDILVFEGLPRLRWCYGAQAHLLQAMELFLHTMAPETQMVQPAPFHSEFINCRRLVNRFD